jgi:hypothetical protein
MWERFWEQREKEKKRKKDIGIILINAITMQTERVGNKIKFFTSSDIALR